MKKDTLFSFNFSPILPIGMLIFLLFFSQWYSGDDPRDNESLFKETYSERQKHKGAHVFGIMDTTTDFKLLTRNNLEWVTLVSWAYQDDYNSPVLTHHNGDSTLIINSNTNWIKRIKLLKEAGFKVFVKPHVWISSPSNGKWRSDIYPANVENWKLWKASYRDFILRYANLAELAKADMFCIGVELSKLTVEKPEFWNALIKEVRSVYSGKITYAANWYKEYEEINIWEDLDYIGIQAYFPLVKNKYPEVEQLTKGWSKYLSDMEAVSMRYNRKILFTEMGYKSTADSAIKPWEWIEKEYEHEKVFSAETQANCYQAFFDSVWNKDWFAGVHLWQLRTHYRQRREGHKSLNFTPQGKPAEEVIASGFK